MHDPMTLAFTIPGILDIWHVDPETDGTDNSCGWGYPRATDKQCLEIARLAATEWDIFFNPTYGGGNMNEAKLIYNAIRIIRWHLFSKQKMTQADYHAVFKLAWFAGDNLALYCRDAMSSKEEFERVLHCVLRDILKRDRPWWKHPRWHVHHWKIRITIVQTLKWKVKRWKRNRTQNNLKG